MNEILRVLVCLNEDIGNIKTIQSGIIKAQQKTEEKLKSASVNINNISGDCYRASSGIEHVKDTVENILILLDNIKILCFSIIIAVAVVTLSAIFYVPYTQHVSTDHYNMLMKRCENITMLLAKKSEFWYSVKNKKLFFREISPKHK